ncbi:MAG TPA: carboxypeptidase regulatory-like domain-containing protein [Vicinamibacterales bacterium]|nr:carboxypeptidase regulatory-like domain-containing protein [Vicinamibacterales bacterium]
MRQLTRALLLLVGLLALPAASGAQVLGTIAGNVKDGSGAVLPGVTVEAASPALIEKVRSAVTDGSGQYRIVNLPPGTYSVTFTLTGFSTVKREGVEVSPSFTSNIDGELKVGAVQETITVTGESPIVDIQSSAQTRAMTDAAFKELPTGGSWIQMAALVPAVHAGNTDVGGVLGDQTGAQVDAHGSRPGDGVSMIDGLRIGNMYIDSNLTNMSLSPLLFDQVDVSLSGQMGETGTNGVIMNAIPKSGGNTFSGSLLANGSGPSLQGGNVTDRLQARGLQNASSTLKTLYDINGAVGGPIKRDKLWFYATSRYFTNEYYLASRFYAVDPTTIVRANDPDRQSYGGTYTYDNNARLTWSINNKQKLSGWYAYQYKVDPHWLIQIFTASPEAVRVTTWHTQLSTTKWTYTATNHLLFEAGIAAGASPDTIKLDPEQVGTCSSQGSLAPRCISITEQTTGLVYRAPGGIIGGFDFDDRLPSQTYNASMSYVTGSHNFKVGFENQRGHFWRGDNNDSTGGIWYTFTGGAPAFVTIQAPAYGYQNNLNYNLGIYAQDRWTINRMTLSGGVRLDFLNESTEPFTLGPHRWLPNRNTHYDAVENVPNWKDFNPRVSLAYDLFGTGKTALKASASRGVAQNSVAIAAANNPAATVRTQTQRTWNDAAAVPGGIPGDFVPQCDLTSGAANGECGPWQSPDFGSSFPGTRYDTSIMNGWGVRPYNWEYSAGVQQEVAPRVSVSAGYFRRIYGNFQITDNEALSAGDFTQYSVTAPTTSTLGGTLPNAGATISGLYDQNAIVTARNVVKDASVFGTQLQHWNGFDVSVDARLRNGVFLQGGVSTGKTLTDNCEIVAQAPELLTVAGVQSPASFCHQESPFLSQYKALASYTLPWYGVRVSGTLQSLPGPVIAANNIYNENPLNATGSYRPVATTLARPFTLGQANVNLIQPNTLYGDRLNQIDLRLTKIVNVGHGRVDLNVDFYNAFNSDAVITELGTFAGAWRLPLTVIQPRFVKFAARWDF